MIRIIAYDVDTLTRNHMDDIEMVISDRVIYFQGKLKDQHFVFVTKRNDIATFKSIKACKDFISEFLPDKKITVRME
ncbi:hypothetical protein EJA03_20085 [Vibrio pectenicida]|uniref:Uncharacterized protein n=2 Tax=Vibrio pectenicida TaxID=62763 RepID=A0A3R9EBI5_9VIBR|nr:hypothetical protein EJA03_20085 [Vibrio pectenicida]